MQSGRISTKQTMKFLQFLPKEKGNFLNLREHYMDAQTKKN